MEVVDRRRENASSLGRKEEGVLRELFLSGKMRKCNSYGLDILKQKSRQCHGLRLESGDG